MTGPSGSPHLIAGAKAFIRGVPDCSASVHDPSDLGLGVRDEELGFGCANPEVAERLTSLFVSRQTLGMLRVRMAPH